LRLNTTDNGGGCGRRWWLMDEERVSSDERDATSRVLRSRRRCGRDEGLSDGGGVDEN